MHSRETFERHIQELYESAEKFKRKSREIAASAQGREMYTIQPKELTSGIKAGLVIENYLGGLYHLTIDEWKVINDAIGIIECKHTERTALPSRDDIKDALLKMALWTNLKSIQYGGESFPVVPILRLTFAGSTEAAINKGRNRDLVAGLKEEATTNRFQLWLNDQRLA